MAKYKYINENVLNEFLGRILKSLAGKSGKKAASLLKADPEMQKLMKKFGKRKLTLACSEIKSFRDPKNPPSP